MARIGSMKIIIISTFLLCLNFACSSGDGSPIQVYKTFVDAAKKKDAATMKKYLSEESMADIKAAAKLIGKSEDVLLTMESDKLYDHADISNEKIDADGKTATLEVTSKNAVTKSGLQKQTVNFVKEVTWKIHYGKPKTTSK